MKRLAKYTLGVKLGIGQGVLVLVVMAAFTAVITAIVIKRSAQQAELTLVQQADTLVGSMASYHAALCDSADKLAAVFRSDFSGAFTVDANKTVAIGDKQTPVLKSGATVLNLNTDIVDRFTSITKAVATVFVRSGDDFVRVATSLKKEDGSRAIGTALDKSHPAYQGLLKGDTFVGKATLFGKDYMTKYVPVKDGQGTVVAVLFTGLDFTDGLKALKEKIRATKVGQTGYIFALDAKPGKDQGKLMVHPAQEGANIIDAKDESGHKFIKEMIEKKEGVIRYPWINKEMGDTSPREKIAAYRYLKEWNWVIGVGSYMDEFNSLVHLVRNTITVTTVIVIILLLCMFTLMIRAWVTKPIHRLLLETDRYASGDFSMVAAPAPHEDKPADEVELLSQGVNNMASSLRDILVRVMTSAHEVGTAATQVNVSAEQIATGTDEITAKTITVGTAGEEMSATSNDISRNCLIAAEGAQIATRSAQSGTEVVQKTVSVMNQIAEKVQESAKTVEQLGARGNQIGEIIGTIEDIADQTNLLALNAAIEAARAGEQGRGFAVVADEVRALAERTTRATHEISEMIKAIQRETKGAVTAMVEGVRQVESGTLEAAKSGEALQGILEQINAVTTQINQIATAAEEQTSTTCEIANSITQVTTIVQATATGAHESATAASQLNSNAIELQRLVNQFKLA